MPEAAELEKEKRLAAEVAAGLVEDGMWVGLGTGSTVAYLLPALAARRLTLRCVATSPATARAAAELGLVVEELTAARLDIAIDGADQVDPDGWLVKGGGGAHTREKVVAAAAERFVVICDSSKAVGALRPPIPLELLEFGLSSTLARLGSVELRNLPASPDGNVLANYTGEVGSSREMAARLGATPGVVEHGLFPPEMVSLVLVGENGSVRRHVAG